MLEYNLDEAIKILKEGGIVIYPTDTAFGIGCRIDNEKSIKRLFKLRRRPLTQAIPVLVNSKEMALKYFHSPLPDNVRHLMDDYWPGALTIVYNCNEALIASLVRGNGETIGLRMPNHDVPLKLIIEIGVPILGPSANFHTQPTPFEFEDIDKELIKLADYIIPGKCMIGDVSTVIDCTNKPWKIVRQGAIKLNLDQKL